MNYPYFEQFVALVYQKAPLQKKKLEKYLASQSTSFFEEAENFAVQYTNYLVKQNIPLDYATGAYLKMCNDMMKCQVSFMKTGVYPVKISGQAFEEVYNNPEEMKSYMIGLALSQFLWATHYDIFSCLKKALADYATQTKTYLEIGPGHGLFLSQAVGILKNCHKYVAVDISETSISITKSIMAHLFVENQPAVTYHTGDMLEMDINEKYDFITMGEVIEHVNFPEKLLTQFCNLLSNNGKGFISTCVDCPAIDHVYHFHSVEEIREMLRNCGLRIVEERVCPVENLPMEEIIRRKITINYCAIVAKL
jgi:2-polyprenyl-3-methyl-5-hydroxy-6-metoxy-1,4-benzoquinol methylase